MALVLGTNCGFVETRPTTDPAGPSAASIETISRSVFHTTPLGNIKVSEIGFYQPASDGNINFEVGIYSDSGNSEPEKLLHKVTGNLTGITTGWKTVSGLDISLDAETNYWLAISGDAGTGNNEIDISTTGALGAVFNNTGTGILPSDWGTSTSVFASGSIALYALVEQATSDTGNLRRCNLFTESYNMIKDFINTNISDPRNRHKKQWVHAAEPNITSQKFDGYPFIVVNVDVAEEAKSFNRKTSNRVFRVLISVYSDEPTEVDSVSDEVVWKFNDNSLSDSLADFKSLEIASSPFVMFVLGGKKIYRRDIGLIGRKRL